MALKFPVAWFLAAATIVVALLGVPSDARAHGNHVHNERGQSTFVMDRPAAEDAAALPDVSVGDPASFPQSAVVMPSPSEQSGCLRPGCCGATCTACASVIQAALNGLALPSGSEDFRLLQSPPPVSLPPAGLRKPPKSFI